MATESFNKTFIVSNEEIIDRFINKLKESPIPIKVIRKDIIEESKKATKVLASKLDKESRMIELTDKLNPNNNQRVSSIEDLNDGYHTFKELYLHRTKLFNTLLVLATKVGVRAWWSHRHYDGELCFDSEEWCIGCIEVDNEREIRYHFNINEASQLESFKALELPKAASPRNGNTPEITLEAMDKLLEMLDSISRVSYIDISLNTELSNNLTMEK